METATWQRAGTTATVLGHEVFYVDSDPGSDRPALVLVHGFPTASYDWVKIWPALTKRYRCVAPDLLGFGFSDKPLPHHYSIMEQADLVEALVRHLSVDAGPGYHLLAHDYGDTVAQELLARDNAREHHLIRSVCLLNGGLFPETHLARPIQKLLASPAGPLLSRVLAQKSFNRSFSRVFGAHTKPSAAELDAFWSLITHKNGRHVFSSLIGYMAERRAHRTRWVNAIEEFPGPVQLINGSVDPVSGAHMVARYRQVIRRPTNIVELADIGHYPQCEAPSAVAENYLAFLTRSDATTERPWDVLIQNATVFDGRADHPCQEDVAISGGRIVARGPSLSAQRAQSVVDATGRWLIPGMIDLHTHFDLEVELAPALPEAVRHGSTTVIMSNCSLGLAFGNQRRDGADPIVDCFARVENVPKDVLRKVADQGHWHTSAEYLAHLESLPLGANVVPMIPHSMLRIEVMGLDSSISRDPTPTEMKRMQSLVEQGMQEGYAGFSTDALPFHYLANAPNEKKKIPGQYGSYQEIKALTDIVRKYDRVWQATPPKDHPPEVTRLFSLTSGLLHGRPLRTTAVAALDIESNRTLVHLGLTLCRLLNGPLQGHFRLQALAAPFKTWAEGAITPIAEEIPELRVLNEPDVIDRPARERIMADPDWQQRFLRMWRTGKEGVSVAAIKRRLRNEDFAISRNLNDMVVERCPIADWTGERLSEVYARLERFRESPQAARSDAERDVFTAMRDVTDDATFMLFLLRRFDRELVWWTISANADPAGVEARLFDRHTLPGFSDSGAHLSNMAFYDANLRALQIAQRRGEGAVATMVRRLTSEPASFFGLDVGTLDVGARADLVLIDPSELAAYDADRCIERVYRDDLETEQLVNRPAGVVTQVWVGGAEIFDGTELAADAGTRAFGQLLRPTNHWPSALEAATG